MASTTDPSQTEATYRLRDNFFNPTAYLAGAGLGAEQLLAGMIGQQAQSMDR